MDQQELFNRIKQMQCPIGELPDPTLKRLIQNSRIDRLTSGIALFNEGDVVTHWYLLLTGAIKIYAGKNENKVSIGTLTSGALFGEQTNHSHCCSSIVVSDSELIAIDQKHFLNIYRANSTSLQNVIINLDTLSLPTLSDRNGKFNKINSIRNRQHNGVVRQIDYLNDGDNSDHYRYMDNQIVGTTDVVVESPDRSWMANSSVFELSNSISTETKVEEAGVILQMAMESGINGSLHMIRDRKCHLNVYNQCMIGAEMVDWLMQTYSSLIVTNTLTRFQAVGMWCALFENRLIDHVNHEYPFTDKYLFYRWTIDDRRLISTEFARRPQFDDEYAIQQLRSALVYLSTIGPDAMFRMILQKSSHERNADELQLVYEELLHVKALSHLSTMVKRELASVIIFEQMQHAGTVLFDQGDDGKSWYIILKGSVNVSIHGKGIVCTLHEGDDFGKLALVNDAPRAATIALREDNSQFLRVDKHDFNRILLNAEANTVRLKEHDRDVLVLEKITLRFPDTTNTASSDRRSSKNIDQHCYSVVAGLAENILEYLLETRIDAQHDDRLVDTLLDDFLLTHQIFMPTNMLSNSLKTYYQRGCSARNTFIVPNAQQQQTSSMIDYQQQIMCKRRVISFVQSWVTIVGNSFFLDPVANAFVEELYCNIVEDSRHIPGIESIVHQFECLMTLREQTMHMCTRPPATILECGVYRSDAPATVLPFDRCTFAIYGTDGAHFTLNLRLDKSAKDICQAAAEKISTLGGSCDGIELVELKSNGEKLIIAPTEISIPTLLTLNGRLFLCYKDQIETLTVLPEQNDLFESVHSATFELLSSTELASQLAFIHAQLFQAVHDLELLSQIIGRDQLPGRVPSNLDLLIRRFNEVQFWTTTEILLAKGAARRVNILKKFIKIAQQSKEFNDLLGFFAIVLGMSNVAVSRLTRTWDKLPNKIRRQFAEFESLLDPSRNHRAYRLLISKLSPPIIPFVPLILKDLTFVHDGNKSYFDDASGLINFEKMHMVASVLRLFRHCKSKPYDYRQLINYQRQGQNLVRNFKVVDNQRQLMELSYMIEPARIKTNSNVHRKS